jgi:hypothetical protein
LVDDDTVKERELKDLFVNAIKSGHIQGNIFDLTRNHDFVNEKIIVKNEYYFRSFDLVVVRILKGENLEPSYLSMQECESFNDILVRRKLLSQFARIEGSRIDHIHFYPVELKSDDDVLDERLPNQILNAILTFGRSILVLDENHSKRVVHDRMLSLFPSTIVGYTGKDDFFEMLYSYDRFVANTFFDMPRRQIARALFENGLGNKVGKMHKVISIVQKINQKIIFNEMFNGELDLSPDELEFIEKLSDYRTRSEKKELRDLIRESMNNKITEYF